MELWSDFFFSETVTLLNLPTPARWLRPLSYLYKGSPSLSFCQTQLLAPSLPTLAFFLLDSKLWLTCPVS